MNHASNFLFIVSLIGVFTGCSISKPCSEGGDITWNPVIKGDKKCTLKKNAEGKRVLDGKFEQTYATTNTVALQGQFENGKKAGIWIYYGEDSKLKAVKYFDHGVEITPPPAVQKQMDLILIQKSGADK